MLMRIKDNNGVEKEIPCIKAPDGESAYQIALAGGFSGPPIKLNKNLALMDNPYYPIGAVYYSVSSTSPGDASVLGFGTWEQLEDVFILAAGSSYTLNATGGEATHTLTTSELPSHRHYETRGRWDGSTSSMWVVYNSKSTTTVTTQATGGGGAHNNMPPYQVVYAWKRVS